LRVVSGLTETFELAIALPRGTPGSAKQPGGG